jgi:hypothetical protein
MINFIRNNKKIFIEGFVIGLIISVGAVIATVLSEFMRR